MPDIHLGCIGCGFIAGIHLANAARLPGLALRAVADVRPEAARGFQQRFQAGYWTAEPDEVLSDPDIDAVLICTYASTHAEYAVRAAAAGKHVLVEKPMARSAAECLEIIDACRQSGVVLALDLKFRYSAAAQAVKRHIARPVAIVCHAAMDKLEDGNCHVNPAFGAGLLENLGAHSLDLASFFAGSQPVEAFAYASRLSGRSQVACDLAAGTLRFANGCLASFLISDCGEWPYTSKWFFQVADGERTAVIYNHCRSAAFHKVAAPAVEAAVGAHEVGTLECLQDFAAAIRDGRPAAVGGREGLQAALVAEAIRRSIQSGRPSAIPATATPARSLGA